MRANFVPAIQAAFTSRQKSVRRRGSREAAPIEIAFQWKNDAVCVGVVAGGGDQARLRQGGQRVTQCDQPTAQARAGSITDAHVIDHFWGLDSALTEIGHGRSVSV